MTQQLLANAKSQMKEKTPDNFLPLSQALKNSKVSPFPRIKFDKNAVNKRVKRIFNEALSTPTHDDMESEKKMMKPVTTPQADLVNEMHILETVKFKRADFIQKQTNRLIAVERTLQTNFTANEISVQNTELRIALEKVAKSSKPANEQFIAYDKDVNSLKNSKMFEFFAIHGSS